MSAIVTDLRTIRNEADSTTGWTGNTSVFTSDPDPVESTGSLGVNVSNAVVEAYHTGAAIDLTDSLVSIWALGLGAMRLTSNTGIALLLGDGTNRVSFHVAGSDIAAFRHDTGPVNWQCLVVDTQSLPTSFNAIAGSLGSLNLGAITQIGVTFGTLQKALGGRENCFIDISRYSTSTEVLRISGGTSGDPGNFLDAVELDRSTDNQRAHGVIRELGANLFGVQGPIQFGEPTGSNSSYFFEENSTLAFEDRGVRANRYRITIRDNGVGTTYFQLGQKLGSGTSAMGSNGCILSASGIEGVIFDAGTDTNVTDVFIYGTTFNEFTGGLFFREGHEVIGCTLNNCATLDANGATLVNTKFSSPLSLIEYGSIGTVRPLALLWDYNLDTDGKLDGCEFISSGLGHAIEFGSDTPSTISLRNLSFSGYGADGTNDAAIYNNSGKSITIQTSGSTGITVRNGAGASTVIENVQTFTLTGLVPNTEVRVYRKSDGVELAGVENSGTTFSFDYNYTGDVDVDVFIHNIEYVWIGIESTLTANGVTIPIQQRFDRNYVNPD